MFVLNPHSRPGGVVDYRGGLAAFIEGVVAVAERVRVVEAPLVDDQLSLVDDVPRRLGTV